MTLNWLNPYNKKGLQLFVCVHTISDHVMVRVTYHFLPVGYCEGVGVVFCRDRDFENNPYDKLHGSAENR